MQTPNNSGVSSIYTSNDLTGTTNTNNTNNANNNTNNGGSGNGGGNGNGLQEIIVNPTTASMVSWRLSANGSLLPPHIEAPPILQNSTNPNQKRGAERLFQYLEADGSDPEDYARYFSNE